MVSLELTVLRDVYKTEIDGCKLKATLKWLSDNRSNEGNVQSFIIIIKESLLSFEYIEAFLKVCARYETINAKKKDEAKKSYEKNEMAKHKVTPILILGVIYLQICESFSIQTRSMKPSLTHSIKIRHQKTMVSEVTMKTFTAKDFSVNWQKPDAKGNFGKVYFGTQGMGGLGGQVVVKCPNSDQFALTVFNTEKAVNEKLDRSYSNPRWAKYLGDIVIDGTVVLPAGVGRAGLAYKREAGAGNSLEDFLIDGKDVAGKLGVKKETGVRPELCKKVIGELLVTCVQMHKVGVIHR